MHRSRSTPPVRPVRRAGGVALLLLPVAALAWVPAYAREDPALGGVPFFYWYQLAWVALSILCLAGAAGLLHPPARTVRTVRSARPSPSYPSDPPGGTP